MCLVCKPKRLEQAWMFWSQSKRTLCLAFRGTEQDAMSDFFTDANLMPWSYNLVANDDGSVSRKECSPITTMMGTWVRLACGVRGVRGLLLAWPMLCFHAAERVSSRPLS